MYLCILGAQKNRLIEFLQHMFWMRNKENNFPIPTLIWRPVVTENNLLPSVP